MSQLLGKDLPAPLLMRLSGGEIAAHEGKIIPIVTVDDAGWPHPALLSYYEIAAKDASTLDMALWKSLLYRGLDFEADVLKFPEFLEESYDSGAALVRAIDHTP